MSAITDALAKYNGGANSDAVMSAISAAQQKFGLSDEEVAQGLDYFGKWHTGRFGGGFTGQSSASAISNAAIQNALNTRVSAPSDYYSWQGNWEGTAPVQGALNYAATPEQIKAHTVDDVMLMLQREKAGVNPMDPTSSNFGYNLFAGYGGQQGWTDQDFQKVAQIVGDSGKSVNDFQNALKNRGEGGSWWGPEATMSYLTQQLGLDPSKYIDQTRLNQQQATAATIGQAAQNAASGGGDEFLMQALLGVGAGVLGGSLLGGSGLGTGADIIGSDFAAGVGGSLGGVAGDVAAAANTLGGTVAPGWASAEGGAGYYGNAALDASGLSGLPVGNTGTTATDVFGTGGGEGGSAVDSGGNTFTGTQAGGDNVNLNDLLDSIVGDNSGYTVNDLTAGDAWNGAMNSGGSDWSTGLDTAMNSGQANTGFWDQAKSLLSQGKNIPTSLIKSVFGTDDATAASLSRLLGTGLGGLLDYKASSGQADALKAIADRSWSAGQPYRDRANAAMTPGFDVRSIPGLSSAMDTATETYLRKLSATNGNPAGIGAAPSQTEAFVLGNVALPAWQNYFNANSNAGGLSSLATQSGAAATQSATADGGVYGSLSNTVNKMFAPEVQSSDKLIRSLFGLPG